MKARCIGARRRASKDTGARSTRTVYVQQKEAREAGIEANRPRACPGMSTEGTGIIHGGAAQATEGRVASHGERER